jgi:hypothetical protein
LGARLLAEFAAVDRVADKATDGIAAAAAAAPPSVADTAGV